jgi:arsenate reductase
VRVLFLCMGNSCRSQMAEGFARHYGRGVLEVYSAGTKPTALHPLAVEVMREVGIDISVQYSKGLAEVPEEADLVVTLCDQAAEACPFYPGAREVIHWSLPDPVAAKGTLEEVKEEFRRARDRIRELVGALVTGIREGIAES